MRRAATGLAVLAVAASGIAAAGVPAASDSPEDPVVLKKKGNGKGKGKKKGHRYSGMRLKLFNSCESVIGYGDAQARRVKGPNYQPKAMPPFPIPNSGGPAPPATGGSTTTAPQKKSESTDSFSTTNVQVENVDEPDIVKTNGQTIFAIGGNSLHAIDPRTGQPTLLDSLELVGFSHELLLVGDKILLISQKAEIPESVEPPPLPDPPPPPSPNSGSEPAHPAARTVTILSEIDVSNPAAMQVMRTEEVDGRYVSARLIGDQARVVISTPPAVEVAPPSSLRSPIGGWVPYSEFDDVGTPGTTTEPVLDDCGEVGRPGKFSGLDMLSVLTVDVTKGLPVIDAEGVMSDGDIVYASDKSLYVTTERWLGRNVAKDPSRAATAVHKFDISKPGVTTYSSSGFVRGRVLNQFSMDEHKRVLRIASTGEPVGEADEGGNESFVSMLKESGRTMDLIGRIGNLGRGERIYAVRMIEDNAYVVTFRRVDPLYTLDLSTPTDPRLLGELKILGYSAYLHPLSDNLLLGVGASATSEGSRIGAQVSLFDVSNLKAPKRLSQATVKGTRTSVEDTHHAFLYWQPTRLAVVPVSPVFLRRGRTRGFTGAIGFKIGREKIKKAGRIEHNGIPFDEIQRSLVINGRVFTLSCTGIEVAGMRGLLQEGWTPFPDPDICLPEPFFD